jgi:glycosyltransferase involved in cell wall biosynthesis
MRVAVVIPCFRVKAHILGVIAGIPAEVARIFVVDDGCPEGTGALVREQCDDARVEVLHHAHNQGVGAAVITGYRQALAEGLDVVVKLDGDGQMDGALIGDFVAPIVAGRADYTKGNRFHNRLFLPGMPKIRLLGNALLSFMTKLSSGYWDCFDPTNGFTAISATVLPRLPLERVSTRYFFESDMLFHLYLLRAVVLDIATPARYGSEVSSLKIRHNVVPFVWGNLVNFCRRIFYSYFLYSFSAASVQLLLAVPLLVFGVVFGLVEWVHGAQVQQAATAGTVMLAALPIVVAVQLLLAFIQYDMAAVPKKPLGNNE